MRRARLSIDELEPGSEVHSAKVGTAAEFDGVVVRVDSWHGIVFVRDGGGKVWQRYTRELARK